MGPLSRSLVLVALVTTASVGCRGNQSAQHDQEQEEIGWHPLCAWSGQWSSQTPSFISDTGLLRVRWETKGVAPKNHGTFLLTLRSSVSGRLVAVFVDQKGEGKGVSTIAD